MKERITVTIERSLLRTIDASVDGIEIKNRSHAIELLVERGLRQVIPTLCVILAGGDPRKLLKPVNGKPVIVHNLDLLTKFGVSNVIVVCAKADTRVKDYLNNTPVFDGSLMIVEEKEPLGTAGCLHVLKDRLTDQFLLMNGDELKDVDIREMYRFHKQQHALCTIALTSVSDPSNYGVVLLNGYRIVAFVDKPSAKNPPSTLISAGLYIMDPQVLSFVPKGYARLESVFPKLAKNDQLSGFPFSGQYVDVQTPGVTEKITTLWKGFTS